MFPLAFIESRTGGVATAQRHGTCLKVGDEIPSSCILSLPSIIHLIVEVLQCNILMNKSI